MSMTEAVRRCLDQYAGFTGRARRSEYWWFFLATLLVSILASVVDYAIGTDGMLGDTGLVGALVTVALVLPGLAVTVRRLHDIDKSGWWILVGLIPLIGTIVLIVWACQDSKPANRFGPSPKAPAALPDTPYGYYP